MVRRIKQKTRGGKVVSSKKVKSFGNKTKKETSFLVTKDIYGTETKSINGRVISITPRGSGGGSSKAKPLDNSLALRSKKVDIKTGKVIDPGQFVVNKDFERRKENQRKSLRIERERQRGILQQSIDGGSSQRKRSIEDIVPDIKTKKFSPSIFTKEDAKQIAQAQNKPQAVREILKLKERQAKAQQQKLDSFLKQSTIKPATQQEVNNINKAIDKEIKQREDKGFQRDTAVATTTKAFKDLVSGIKNNKLNILKSAVSPSFFYDVGIEVIKISYKLVKDPIKASYIYGTNLVNRGLWTKNFYVDNPLSRDINKMIRGTASVTKFAVTNPSETRIIVGIAAALAGTSILNTLRTNPAKALAEAIVILNPAVVITAPLKAGQLAVKLPSQFSKSITLIKNSKTVKQLKKNLATIKINLVIYQKKRDSIVKSKKLKGKDKTNAEAKFKSFEKKKGINVPRALIKTEEDVIKALGYDKAKPIPKEVRLIDLTKLNDIRTLSKQKIIDKLHSIKDKKELKNLFKEVNRLGFTIRRIKLNRKIIDLQNGFIRDYKFELIKKDKTNRNKKGKLGRKTKKQLKKKEKEKSIDKDTAKKIIVPIDLKTVEQRKLFWRTTFEKAEFKAALDGRLEAKEFKRSSLFNSKDGKMQPLFVTTKINPSIKTISIKYKKNTRTFNNNLKSSRTKYKQSSSKIKSRKVKKQQKEKERKDLLGIYKKQIKDLEDAKQTLKKKKIAIDKVKSKVIKFPILAQAEVLKQLIKLSQELSQELILIEKLLLKTKQNMKQENKRIMKEEQAIAQKTAQENKLVQPLKSISKRKVSTPKKIKSPKKPKKPTPDKPKKPKKPKLPDFDFNKDATKGKKGRIIYKEGNKVIKLNTNLPFNKALKVASQVIDNSLLASMKVQAYGKTKAKDISRPSLKKFTPRIGKNPLVQELVEFRKFRLDKAGEKKDIQIKKLLKKQIKVINMRKRK